MSKNIVNNVFFTQGVIFFDSITQPREIALKAFNGLLKRH